jgi:phage terminase large subunit-like protein
MARHIIEVAENFQIVGAGRDPAMKGACDREIMAADLAWPWTWVEVRQGYITLGPAIKEMERRLTSIQTGQTEDEAGRVVGMVHPHHPILTMCVANAVIAKDPADNCKFEKAKSTGRIDGIVAAANATSLTLTVEPVAEPGFFFV